MKILITGESGVIPQQISKLAPLFNCSIINTQLEETPVDFLKNYQAFNVRKHELDFTNATILEAVAKINKPDLVIHSGAFVGTDYCDSKKDEAVMTNVFGTKLIVDFCNQLNIPIVYFSTTAIFDPKSYGRFSPINENTKINPRTLYGITKYAGELIVKNECVTPYMIVRPVFGFGDYPDDLHSAITKLMYMLYTDKQYDSKLKILLNPTIGKNYFRVENIAYIVLRLIQEEAWGEEINVGENFNERKNWYKMFDLINQASDKVSNVLLRDKNQLAADISEKITFEPESDYLHWHNIDNSRMRDIIGDEFVLTTFEKGLEKTITSIITNQDKKPYWI